MFVHGNANRLQPGRVMSGRSRPMIWREMQFLALFALFLIGCIVMVGVIGAAITTPEIVPLVVAILLVAAALAWMFA